LSILIPSLLEAVTVGHLLREEQNAEQILDHGIHGDKEVEWKCPLLNRL
jgi:hypothetical protein